VSARDIEHKKPSIFEPCPSRIAVEKNALLRRDCNPGRRSTPRKQKWPAQSAGRWANLKMNCRPSINQTMGPLRSMCWLNRGRACPRLQLLVSVAKGLVVSSEKVRGRVLPGQLGFDPVLAEIAHLLSLFGPVQQPKNFVGEIGHVTSRVAV
jgi:hypothetical protein